jgi:hypothetical protein
MFELPVAWVAKLDGESVLLPVFEHHVAEVQKFCHIADRQDLRTQSLLESDSHRLIVC